MHVLVLGSTGMVGHMIALYLHEAGYDVEGYARRNSGLTKTVIGDVSDMKRMEEIISDGKYNYIINCIGILNTDAEKDKALAAYLNSFFPHFLARLTENMDTSVIQLSTDCVFSGDRGGYLVNDIPDGRTFYDRSKALGELVDKKNITLRCSVVGPDINPDGIGLVNWFMKQYGEVKGFRNVIWTGQTTLQLAKTMEALMKNQSHGIYNAVPNQSISKLELLKLFNKYLRRDKVSIAVSDEPKSDKSLVASRFEFDYEIPDYEVMVHDMSIWMSNHKDLYGHYCDKMIL